MGARAARIAEQDARRDQLVWLRQQVEAEARLARTLEQEDA